MSTDETTGTEVEEGVVGATPEPEETLDGGEVEVETPDPLSGEDDDE